MPCRTWLDCMLLEASILPSCGLWLALSRHRQNELDGHCYNALVAWCLNPTLEMSLGHAQWERQTCNRSSSGPLSVMMCSSSAFKRFISSCTSTHDQLLCVGSNYWARVCAAQRRAVGRNLHAYRSKATRRSSPARMQVTSTPVCDPQQLAGQSDRWALPPDANDTGPYVLELVPAQNHCWS